MGHGVVGSLVLAEPVALRPDALVDEITTTSDSWVTPVDRATVRGVVHAGEVAAIRFTDGSGRAPAVAGCLATGMRAVNAVPADHPLTAASPLGVRAQGV